MSDSPDVSVVMSVYNGAAHLRESVESILRQEGVEIELILVNDGSTDESGEMSDTYANRDERVTVVHQENQGLTNALITGCAAAKGQYIARQDVGDVSCLKRLSLQKAALDGNDDLAFVSCWTEFCGPEWEFLYLVKGTGKALSPVHVIAESEKHGVIDGPTHHGSVMFRKSSYEEVGGYRAQFYYGQDWDLWYRLGELGRFQMIQDPSYRVRILPGSLSVQGKRDQDAISRFSLAALRQRRLNLPEASILSQASAIRPGGKRASRDDSDSLGLYFIAECLRRNGDSRAMDYFKRSICDSPFALKTWIRILQCRIGAMFGKLRQVTND